MLDRLSLRTFALLLLASLALPTARAQTEDTTETRLERLAERLEAARIEDHIPGCALAVVREGEVIFARGFGVKNLETGEPVSPDTVFAIGSTSKAFTSALIAMMIDEGKMDWDDTVRTHLPLFELYDERASKRVTVRDLLCHRTGLTRTGALWAGGKASRQRAIRMLAEARPTAPFRSQFQYNNVQFLTAGVCSAVVAGVDWDTLLSDRILKPLGMSATGSTLELLTDNEAASLGYRWDTFLEDWVLLPPRNIYTCAPAGAINSSVLDMTRWIRFQLARGEFEGNRLLSEERFDEMRSPQIAMGPNIGYGLGWMLRQWDGRNVVEHGGNIDGFAAQVTLVPEENLGYVFLANVTATPLQQGSIALVLESLLGEEKPEVEAWAEEKLQPYLGDYYLKAIDANLTVNIAEGKLAVNVPGQTNYKLKWPTEKRRWVFELTDSVEVSFAEPVEDQVPSMTMHQSGVDMEAQRVSADAAGPGITVEEVLALVRKGFGKPNSEAYRLQGRMKMIHQGASADLMSVSDRHNRFRREIDFGILGRTIVVSDGENVLRSEFGGPVRPAVGTDLLQALGENLLFLAIQDWSQVFESVEVLKADEVDDEAVWVVEVKPAHLPASKHFVSQSTGRILESEVGILASGIATFVMKAEYADFREVDGLTIPFRQAVRHEATGGIVTEIWRLEPLDSLPAGTFELGED